MKRWILAMAVLAALFVGASSAQAHWGCRPYRSYGFYSPYSYQPFVYRTVRPYNSFVTGYPSFRTWYHFYTPSYSFGWSYGW
jgi:hypothetical protein